MKQVDLHIHTHFSDGTSTPLEIIKEAKEKGLSAVAITDHDNIDGLNEAVVSAKEFGIDIIPGVELSAESENEEVHILGYFVDWENKIFVEKLKHMGKIRRNRIYIIADKLKKQGIKITAEDILKFASKDVVGRLHIARALYEKKQVSSIREAFEKYIGNNGPCYAEKHKLSVKEAIELIKNVGGIAVLAHPCVLKNQAVIDDTIKTGIDGLEVYYPDCPEYMIKKYEKLSVKYNLIATGGSDYHGAGKEHIYLGKVTVPYTVVEKMRERLSYSSQVIGYKSNLKP